MTPNDESAAPGRLLVVEDSPSDFALLMLQLDEYPGNSRPVDHAASLADAVSRLQTTSYDAILLDLGLPDSDGRETFRELSQASGEAAIVLVTGMNDSLLAEQLVQQGAQDFLHKGAHRPGEVLRAVDYAVRRQRVLAELNRARDEQLLAKDQFLSHVSHELRSPLAVVHQFTSLLLDEVGGPVSSEQREFLEVLMRNVRQLKVMIDDLLEVSRVQRGRVSLECRAVALPVVFAEMLAAYRPRATDAKIELAARDDVLPDVIADPERVREVVANLLDNALKFTPSGGRVTIEGHVEKDSVKVTVRDTGRGIAASDITRVFDQFFQSNQNDEVSRNGLGLGLFVSRDLIKRQGGDMWAESISGQGAAISFTLPTSGQPAALEVTA
jgi:signal transduction histidine kinase